MSEFPIVLDAADLHKHLDANGRGKSPASLRDLWRQTLGDATSEICSVMCGSGVTACHLVVSAVLAGLPEPRLCAGSLSEWIRSPDRAVAVGTSNG